MTALRGRVVCGHCYSGAGTLISAAGGVLVHERCYDIYTMSHPESSAKKSRKARRIERRASGRNRQGHLSQ